MAGPALGLVSMLPPAASGIADYSAALLPTLAARGPVIAFSPSACDPIPGVELRSLADLERSLALGDLDLPIYQLGNHPDQLPLVEMALRVPGVLVLHDLFLHHLWVSSSIDRGRPQAYIREMEYSYGEPGRDLAQMVARRQLTPPFHRLPLCERLIDRSLAVAAHSQFVLDYVGRVRDLPMARIPQPVPWPPAQPEAAPRVEGEFRIGVFGDINANKRMHVVAAAVGRLLASTTRPVSLWVVGQTHPYFDVAAVIEAAGISSATRLTGRLTSAGFDSAMAACDVAISLRHPTVGETSAAALRQMSMGIATVVSDADAMAELPEATCFRVAPGPGEAEELAALLQALAADPALARQVGRAGAEYIARNHRPEMAADAYWNLVQELRREPPAAPVPTASSAPLDGPSRGLGRDLGRAMLELGLDPEHFEHRALAAEVLADALGAGLAVGS